MNGSKFLDFWFGKRNPMFYLLFVLIGIFILFIIIGIIWSIIKGQWSAFITLLIFFTLPALIFYFMFGKSVRRILNQLSKKKEIAKSYGLESKRADFGLMNESDFKLDSDEEKIKFYPAVWFMDANVRYYGTLGGRVSIMITNKRIMVGPGPFSIYFPSKSKKDNKHYWFNSIKKTRYLFFIKGFILYFHIPERLAGYRRFFPTPGIIKRQEPGYVVSGFYFFPENIDQFIDVINKAQE